MKIGEDDQGKKLKIEAKYYLEYLVYNRDDSPLYLFEPELESLPKGRELLNYYKPPKYFRNNYLSIVLFSICSFFLW